jgi:hypothetical protein
LVLDQLTAPRRAKKFKIYERKFGDGSEGPKETWKNIELAIHDGVSPKKKEISISKDGRILKVKENSEALNNHFVSVAANVTSDLNSSLGCSTRSRYVEDDFVLTPTNDDEVKEIVAYLKRTTAAGLDGIKLSTIRYCTNEISECIVKIIINISIDRFPRIRFLRVLRFSKLFQYSNEEVR